MQAYNEPGYTIPVHRTERGLFQRPMDFQFQRSMACPIPRNQRSLDWRRSEDLEPNTRVFRHRQRRSFETRKAICNIIINYFRRRVAVPIETKTCYILTIHYTIDSQCNTTWSTINTRHSQLTQLAGGPMSYCAQIKIP